MFRHFLSVASLLCVPQLASAGTITFDPPTADALPGQALFFEVWLSETELPQFDTVSALIGVHAPLTLDFNSNPKLCWGASDGCATWGEGWAKSQFGLYEQDTFFGGNRFTYFPPAPFWLGTLRVDMPADAAGVYELLVSSEEEQRRIGGAISAIQSGTQPAEPLEGRLTIRVIPDPAAVLLLGVGMLSLGMSLKRVPKGGRECSRSYSAR